MEGQDNTLDSIFDLWAEDHPSITVRRGSQSARRVTTDSLQDTEPEEEIVFTEENQQEDKQDQRDVTMSSDEDSVKSNKALTPIPRSRRSRRTMIGICLNTSLWPTQRTRVSWIF
jgi:hypothetical protein